MSFGICWVGQRMSYKILLERLPRELANKVMEYVPLDPEYDFYDVLEELRYFSDLRTDYGNNIKETIEMFWTEDEWNCE